MTTRHDRGETTRALALLTLAWAAGLAASGWQPYDRATWWMEVAPALIALPILWATARRFPLTRLAIWLIGLHGLVLMLGGAYTYARVPPGFHVQEWLHLARNPYDRFGHFMQGFVPAIVLRELMIRGARLRPGVFVSTMVMACCLAISATYELIEFAAAMLMGQDAEAFLGTQGDVWDTQWDMLMCVIGAATALILLSRLHDAQVRQRMTIQISMMHVTREERSEAIQIVARDRLDCRVARNDGPGRFHVIPVW